ncbi:MAG: arylesterase [Acidobacteriota bacterium]
MKKIFFSLALVAITSLAACQNNAKEATADKVSNAPSSPALTANKTSAPQKNSAKVVAFGDSLTAGYGLSPQQSYPSLLQEKLRADGFDYEVINAGISGDTSAGGVRRIDWSLESGDVKFVIIELGANDMLRGQPVEAMKKNLSAIIERAKAKGATVLLAGMEAPTNSGADYRRKVHEAFPQLAKEHRVTLIPFFLEGVAGMQTLNQQDGIHPNPEGTRLVMETVYKYLQPLLEKARQQPGR